MPQRTPIIICSVFIAISILFGLYSWGVVKSPIYAAVVMSIILSTLGSFALYSAFNGVRRGVVKINAKGSLSVYDRRRNPFGFWFYIFLFTLIGLMVCGTAFFILLHPHLHR